MLMRRHQFVSGAVADLNRLYGVQLSVSLSILFVMALCDIFEVVSAELNATKTTLMLYGWMLQYAFRFCTIVQMTHATTKQANSIVLKTFRRTWIVRRLSNPNHYNNKDLKLQFAFVSKSLVAVSNLVFSLLISFLARD